MSSILVAKRRKDGRKEGEKEEKEGGRERERDLGSTGSQEAKGQ